MKPNTATGIITAASLPLRGGFIVSFIIGCIFILLALVDIFIQQEKG
jgi:hypothetical protein